MVVGIGWARQFLPKKRGYVVNVTPDFIMVGTKRLELATSGVTGTCSIVKDRI